MTTAVPDVHTNKSRGNMMVPCSSSSRRERNFTLLETSWVLLAHIGLHVCPWANHSGWGWHILSAEALREITPVSRVVVTPPLDDNGTEIQSIGVQKEGECVMDSKQQMSTCFPFCSYLGHAFNEMCSGACYAKIGVCNGGIIIWGSVKGYALPLCGGRKNCIIMFFRWGIRLLWGLYGPKSLKVKVESRVCNTNGWC